MTQRKSPKGQPGAGAAAWAADPAANSDEQFKYTTASGICQPPLDTGGDLAAAAQRRAGEARRLAGCGKGAGERAGAWRRHPIWGQTHPQEVAP